MWLKKSGLWPAFVGQSSLAVILDAQHKPLQEPRGSIQPSLGHQATWCQISCRTHGPQTASYLFILGICIELCYLGPLLPEVGVIQGNVSSVS